jgi:NAD(P)-dependent dehydrogenase (short-subunit alcohol dehydrogenase family)
VAGKAADAITVDCHGRRTTFDEIDRPITAHDSNLFANKPVIVASGGARGITAACLIALAKIAPVRVALFGRTNITAEPDELQHLENAAEIKAALVQASRSRGESLTPKQLESQTQHILAHREVLRTLDILQQLGSEAVYWNIDIRDVEATNAAVAEARRRWGRIDMLIHGAGTIADKRIVDKSLEQFRAVFGTKVLGLRSLLDATREDPLRFICIFSSVAGRYGNVGQADYAMANAAMSCIAREEAVQRGPQCIVRALSWGPWNGGMVTPELREHFAARGIPVISIEEGGAAFVRELQNRSADPIDVDVVLVARAAQSTSH